MRYFKRSISYFTGFLTEDRTKQSFFSCKLCLSLRSNLTYQDISGTDFCSDTDDSSFIQILQWREKLTADEIYRRRNSKETTEVIEKIRTELYDLLANPDENRSELMSKALNYLKNFWNQIFAYRNDGEYSIDNMAAERAIRPITVQRKNSLFFGSVKGIQNSAIYNTFIETCKQAGVSFRDYFCKLLRELKKGRTDYENLLPMTICK